jgi:hypothetical protein
MVAVEWSMPHHVDVLCTMCTMCTSVPLCQTKCYSIAALLQLELIKYLLNSVRGAGVHGTVTWGRGGGGSLVCNHPYHPLECLVKDLTTT